jgi:hypothetical protein
LLVILAVACVFTGGGVTFGGSTFGFKTKGATVLYFLGWVEEWRSYSAYCFFLAAIYLMNSSSSSSSSSTMNLLTFYVFPFIFSPSISIFSPSKSAFIAL